MGPYQERIRQSCTPYITSDEEFIIPTDRQLRALQKEDLQVPQNLVPPQGDGGHRHHRWSAATNRFLQSLLAQANLT